MHYDVGLLAVLSHYRSLAQTNLHALSCYKSQSQPVHVFAAWSPNCMAKLSQLHSLNQAPSAAGQTYQVYMQERMLSFN